MKLLIKITLLLLIVSCNPVKKLARAQSQINDLTDAVNNSRVIISRDSLVFIPGTKDSLIIKTRDSATNTYFTNEYYYTHDTVKVITQDVVLLNAARRVADIATGELRGAISEIQGKQKLINTFLIIALVEAFLIGLIIYFKIKL